MFKKVFIKTTAERAIQAMASSLVALVAVSATIQGVEWTAVGGAVALSGLISVASSLAGRNFNDKNTPSWVDTAERPPW